VDPAISSTRIDKWLWVTRFFKTRSLATDACKKKQIRIGEQPLKPSRIVQAGEIITLKKGPLTQHLRILHVLDRRAGASKARECYEDLTPQENYQKAREQKRNQVQLKIESSAKGRPSKKQRRDLEAFFFQE
tara:strand:- start:34 stop:429 length:396 start_codon:yes stop_codon:yes gene_type:complete